MLHVVFLSPFVPSSQQQLTGAIKSTSTTNSTGSNKKAQQQQLQTPSKKTGNVEGSSVLKSLVDYGDEDDNDSDSSTSTQQETKKPKTSAALPFWASAPGIVFIRPLVLFLVRFPNCH